MILSYFSESKAIGQWLDNNGKIVGVDEITKDFDHLKLLLKSLPPDDRPNAISRIDQIKHHVEHIAEKHNERLPFLHPEPLLEITEHLALYPELAIAAGSLIKPLLPESDLWPSPIVESYLRALLVGQQMATLDSVISTINKNEWTAVVWEMQSFLFGQQTDYIKAIEAIGKALALHPSSLNAWYNLVYLHRKNGTANDELALILKDIPDEILANVSASTLTLLIEIAATGDFARAEKTLLSWFIQNPGASVEHISNFYFCGIHTNLNLDPTPETVGDAVIGVRFKKDDQEFTKLLVQQQRTDHPNLLDIHSNLGQALYNMTVGETKRQGLYDLTLFERLPPYVAIFRISLLLRNEQSDGKDGFCLFSVPVDPEPGEVFDLIQRKLSRGDGIKVILDNPDLPFIFKGKMCYREEPVKAALHHFSTPEPACYFLPNFGEESTEIILDVYVIAYLAVTGLAQGLEHVETRFIITHETKMVVEEWLKNAYWSVLPQGDIKLWLPSDDEVTDYFKNIVESMRAIINKAEIIRPSLFNASRFVLSLQEIVDVSVYSSLCLSISNNIPWLCIDEVFAHYLTQQSNYHQANAVKLVNSLGNGLSFEQKKRGLYLQAARTIPFPLTYTDLKSMSLAKDEHAHYFLAKLIYQHPKAFPDTKTAIAALVELLVPVLAKAFLDGHILRGLRIHNPSNNGYAERVFKGADFIRCA